MQAIDLAYRAMKPIAVAALIVGLGMPFSAYSETAAPKCDAPLHLLRLANPLTHFAQKLATRGPITIVAIGSSSTAGAGASSPATNYPNRLAEELKRRFPTHSITVLNRGVNGEEVDDMLKRLDKDVVGRLPGCATLEAVVIEGHTDRLGSQQYNQKLSERRADNVKKYLVSKGVAAGKIETIGMGKTVPATFCPDTKNRKALIACLAPSRRAIVSIKGPAK